MDNYFDKIQHIRQLIINDLHLGLAIGELRSLIGSMDDLLISKFSSQIDEVDSDYQLMKDYLLKGYKDPKQSDVFKQLIIKLFRLTQNLELEYLKHTNLVFSQAKRNVRHFNLQMEDMKIKMEAFVQNVALVSLENMPNQTQTRATIYEEHFYFMNELFDFVLISPQWNDGVRDFTVETLLLPTLDSNDVQLIITAIMLSCMNVFDINKFKALTDIYIRTNDEHIRQRALVGWAFALPYLPKMETDILGLQKIITELTAQESIQKDLLELQMQVFYCKNTERDNQEIQSSILPNIMKNNNFQITRFGIVEKEEDSMEDILNPGAADKETEELEKSISKIMEMQKQGTDIYFGGFSQMKRFAFFNDLSNWFVPFNMDHPSIQHIYTSDLSRKILKNLYEEGPFCDSDEYSFALGLSHAIENLPSQIKDMLSDTAAFGNRVSGIEKESPIYIRRMYLQNLYRFFRVYPQREQLFDPFNYEHNEGYNPYFFTNPFLKHLPSSVIKDLEKFLVKQKLYQYMIPLCELTEGENDIEQILMNGFLALRTESYDKATILFNRVLLQDQDNILALKGLAQSSFNKLDFETVESCYQRLVEKVPNNRHYQLSLCISQISNGHEQQGVNSLFKLDYQYPNEPNIKRALAWGLMLVGKCKQSENIYSWLLTDERIVTSDYLNAGYCKWILGNQEEGIKLFKTYLSSTKPQLRLSTIEKEFQKDRKILEKNNISKFEQKIIAEIVCL